MRGKETPLKEVAESFIADRHDLAESTASNYKLHLAQFGAWCERSLGREALVGDVEPGTVNEYLAQRKRHQPPSARKAWNVLRSFGNFLAERGISGEHGENPLRLVKEPKVKDNARRALKDDELWRLIERADSGEQGARDRAIVVTLAGTGLRVGELVGLRLNDVDIHERALTVRAVTSKSVHAREVAIPVEVIKELDRYVRDHRKGPESDDAPLFTDKRGRQLTNNAVRLLFDRLKVRAAIGDLCAHMLRHTWATNYHRSGTGSILDLQAEGGWQTPRMVGRYAKRRPLEERRRAPSPFAAARPYARNRSTEKRSSQQRSARLGKEAA